MAKMKNHLSGVNFIVTSYRMRPQDPVEVLAEAVSRSADTFHIFRDLLVLHVEVRTSALKRLGVVENPYIHLFRPF